MYVEHHLVIYLALYLVFVIFFFCEEKKKNAI